MVAKIIQRNSTIPASAVEHFTTGVDGQTNVAIHVVQGEREMAKDCRSLARFDLKNIPPMVAGLPRIEVKFLIDANGILHVSAREQRSGKEAEVDVKPTYGLTDEQVETMILDSFDNAETDIEERQTIETKNEGETILAAVEKGQKHEAWQKLSADEIEKIEQKMKELKASLDGGNRKVMRQGDRWAGQGDAAVCRVDDGRRGGWGDDGEDDDERQVRRWVWVRLRRIRLRRRKWMRQEIRRSDECCGECHGGRSVEAGGGWDGAGDVSA